IGDSFGPSVLPFRAMGAHPTGRRTPGAPTLFRASASPGRPTSMCRRLASNGKTDAADASIRDADDNDHDQTTGTRAAFRRRRRRSTRPDAGHDRRQGHPEIPASELRAALAEEGPEETTDGTGSHTEASR